MPKPLEIDLVLYQQALREYRKHAWRNKVMTAIGAILALGVAALGTVDVWGGWIGIQGW